MNTYLKGARSALAVSLIALAAACGSGSSTNDQNMQGPIANDSAQAMPTGPFAQAEQMHERMVAATGANASETWVRKMIEHHRGALEMSQILINGGGDPGFVQMARADSAKQQREITELERLLSGGVSGGSGEANPYGPVEQSMHQQMMAATGANLSEAWARKMIAHHQGAIDMSEVLVRQGGDPRVVAMARRVAQDQSGEIAHLEGMLRGEVMPDAAEPAAPAAKSAPVAAAKESPRPTPTKAAPQPSAAPKAPSAPRSAPTPEPSPAPKADCTPEHAAMGHCEP